MIFLPPSSIMNTLRQNPGQGASEIAGHTPGVLYKLTGHNGSACGKVFKMEQWEYDLRDDIFSAFMMNNKKAASFLLQDLIEKKGGVFYRYRPLDMAEISSIRFDQMYLCRAVRFDNHTDGMLRFKSYVSCFTDRKNSLSMWNDYADAAQGLCMEYQYIDIQDFAEENGLFFSPVKYSDETGDESTEDRVATVMSMMHKPRIESDEYEWRLWKIDMHSTDIGKIMSSIRPRRIYIGRNADRDSYLYNELREICEEKGIELI